MKILKQYKRGIGIPFIGNKILRDRNIAAGRGQEITMGNSVSSDKVIYFIRGLENRDYEQVEGTKHQ